MAKKDTKTVPTWYELKTNCSKTKSINGKIISFSESDVSKMALSQHELLLYPETTTIYFLGYKIKLKKDQFNYLKCILKEGRKKGVENKYLILEAKKDNCNYNLPDDNKKIANDLAQLKTSIKKSIKSAILHQRHGNIEQYRKEEKQKIHKSVRVKRFDKQIKLKFKIKLISAIIEEIHWITTADDVINDSYCSYKKYEFDKLFTQLIDFNGVTYFSNYRKGRLNLLKKQPQ